MNTKENPTQNQAKKKSSNKQEKWKKGTETLYLNLNENLLTV